MRARGERGGPRAVWRRRRAPQVGVGPLCAGARPLPQCVTDAQLAQEREDAQEKHDDALRALELRERRAQVQRLEAASASGADAESTPDAPDSSSVSGAQ